MDILLIITYYQYLAGKLLEFNFAYQDLNSGLELLLQLTFWLATHFVLIITNLILISKPTLLNATQNQVRITIQFLLISKTLIPFIKKFILIDSLHRHPNCNFSNGIKISYQHLFQYFCSTRGSTF